MREPEVPLRLAWWAEPGSLLIGAYPGHADPAIARRQLVALLDAGIRVWVGLLEAGEAPSRGAPDYADALRALAAERGHPVAVHRFGIEDHGVPGSETLARVEAVLDAARAEGRAAYLHCWGGRGRSGVVAALELVRRGLAAPDEALAAVAVRRAGLPGASPETPLQERFVRDHAGRRPAAPPAGPRGEAPRR